MKPVVFLDFDNALAVHKFSNNLRVLDGAAMVIMDAFPDFWSSVSDAAARHNLQTLHKEFEPRYVISSTWASYLSLEQMQKTLKRCGLKFVALNLCEHWCTFRDEKTGRLSEIEAWLTLHACEANLAYVIVDSHTLEREWCGSRLEHRTVFCDARGGFGTAELRAAREILDGQCR